MVGHLTIPAARKSMFGVESDKTSRNPAIDWASWRNVEVEDERPYCEELQLFSNAILPI